jgi:5-(carboxyamino)imidazole ribonucleotide synthase
MFLLPGGKVIVNELAPRVHNSGHYTIEGAICSQFENHVRAVFGLPLGSTALVASAVAMVNLIGHVKAPAVAHGVEDALAVPGAHVHIYGKVMSSKGRKMGHVTALGANATEALERARTAASAISFGAPR